MCRYDTDNKIYPHLVQGLHDVAGLVLLGRQDDVNDLIMIMMMIVMMIHLSSPS